VFAAGFLLFTVLLRIAVPILLGDFRTAEAGDVERAFA
jgi:hypothetical protein